MAAVADGLAADIRAAGDRALLLTPARSDQLGSVVDLLRDSDLAGMEDFLAAAETVLVTLTPDADPAGLRRALEELLGRASGGVRTSQHEREEVTIPVRYDGEDLADVADLLRLDVESVIAAHTAGLWRCRFIGFTAGFGYLESADGRLTVPRRATSRTAVPPGAVALADGYSAVYPRRSPGGWQLIGHTETAMWDLARDRPALLRAGTRVRFVRED